MLKKERIKEIHEFLGMEPTTDQSYALGGHNEALLREAIHDLLVERDSIILPAFKKCIEYYESIDSNCRCKIEETSEEIINQYCAREWEEMM